VTGFLCRLAFEKGLHKNPTTTSLNKNGFALFFDFSCVRKNEGKK
jgi:hypothetical protein